LEKEREKSQERETNGKAENLRRWCHGKIQRTIYHWCNQESWKKSP